MTTAHAPLIVGLAGTRLGPDESAFLRDVRPFGIILFARNIETGAQVRDLLGAAQDASGAPLTLVDQEGGRVQRVRPPLAPRQPPGAQVGAAAARNPANAARIGWLSGRLVAGDVAPLGFNTPCLPVADVPVEGAHDVIGDRAYGHDPAHVARVAAAVAEGVLAAGCLPVVKHIPGHGRATADSHFSLPTVRASRAELERDFAPFQALAHLPLAMSAHVTFSAIDDTPATLSPKVVGEVIRQQIGFDGLLMTDDISMRALRGDLGTLSRRALDAGCDAVLHCNGKMREMRTIADALPPMATAAQRRLDAACAALRPADAADLDALRAEFAALVEADAKAPTETAGG